MEARLERLVQPFLAAEATEKQAWVRQVRILDDEVFDKPGAIEAFAKRVHRSPTTLRRWRKCNVFSDEQLAAPLLATTYIELAGRPELITQAIRQEWTPDEARVRAGGGDKHGLTERMLLEQVEKKPSLIDALMRDEEGAKLVANAMMRQAAEESARRALDAPAYGEGPPSPAQPESPWSALWSALAQLALVMDRMSDEAWRALPDSQIEKVRDDADRYAKFLAALSDAADDRLPMAARKE